MTTPPPEAPPVTPAAVVAGAVGALDALDEVMWVAKPAAELLAAVTELERLRSRLAAIEAQVDVEVEATEAAKTEG